VIYEFAAVGSAEALVYLAQKPLVVVHHALDSFDYKRFAGAALLGRQAAEFRLQIGIERHIHGYKARHRKRRCQQI